MTPHRKVVDFFFFFFLSREGCISKINCCSTDSRFTELQLHKLEDLLSLQMFMNNPIEIRKCVLQQILGEGNKLVDLIEDIVSKVGSLCVYM